MAKKDENKISKKVSRESVYKFLGNLEKDPKLREAYTTAICKPYPDRKPVISQLLEEYGLNKKHKEILIRGNVGKIVGLCKKSPEAFGFIIIYPCKPSKKS